MLGMMIASERGKGGITDIAEMIGGGVREGSLIIVEGGPETGKSVMCQHIAYGILQSHSCAVAYYSTDHNSEALAEQMESMSLETRHDLVTDRFRIYKMGSTDVLRNPQKALQLIIDHIKELPTRFKLVVIDSPSPFMSHVTPMIKVEFLYSCKQLCKPDRSIVLALGTHVFEDKTLSRAYSISDYYLKLKSQDTVLAGGHLDMRIIKSLEVTKKAGAERPSQMSVKFEIKPGVGIQILPFIQIKI
jgi:archaellum biogenesis ATPase FlaH